MGVWATGLYSGDFALDLRSTISALVRLPMDGPELLNILRTTDQFRSNDRDPEATTFWLVLADQFQRRGIACGEVLETAIAIIDEDRDIENLTELGMSAPLLKKRRRMLTDLRQRLTTADADRKPRKTIKAPERFLMAEGDVFRYPVSREESINPYFRPADLDRYSEFWKGRGKPWAIDGWGAFVVIGQGRAFGYLAWYSFAKLRQARAEPPVAHDALSGWVLPQQGTCPRLHFERMALEWIGRVQISQNKLLEIVAALPDGTSEAIHGVSIANELDTMPVHGETRMNGNLEKALSWKRQIEHLNEISE